MLGERQYQFYSAKLVEATATNERRVRIVNRETGYSYYRPARSPDKLENRRIELARIVRNLHASPILGVRVLFYDKALEMLFFELQEIDENGSEATD